jgi:hypothetical protein
MTAATLSQDRWQEAADIGNLCLRLAGTISRTAKAGRLRLRGCLQVLPTSKDDKKVVSDAGPQGVFPARLYPLEMPAATVRNTIYALPFSHAVGQEWVAGSRLAAAVGNFESALVPDTTWSLLETLQPLELSQQQMLLDLAGEKGNGKKNLF